MKKTNIKTGWSQEKDENKLVEEVYKQITQDNIKFVYFCLNKTYDQKKINSAWQKKLKDIPFLGISGGDWFPGVGNFTGLITSKGIKDEGLVAISIASDKIKVAVRPIRNLKINWKEKSEKAIREAAAELNLDLNKVDPKKHFGLFLPINPGDQDAIVIADIVLENYYAMSPDLLFTGMGILTFDQAKMALAYGAIHLNNTLLTEDDAVIVLGESEIPFTIETTTNYRPRPEKVFKCQEVNQMFVGKLNGEPAAEVYAKELGISVEKMGAVGAPTEESTVAFLTRPFGMTVGGKLFVRSAYAPAPDKKGLIFFQKMAEGQELFLMDITNIIEDTEKTLREVKSKLGTIEAIFYFSCLWRIKMMQMQNISREEMAKVLNVAPMIGMHGGGEYYGGIVTAATLTLLAFGSNDYDK